MNNSASLIFDVLPLTSLQRIHLQFTSSLCKINCLKFVEVFQKYWEAGNIDWLQESLNKIGYKGSLTDYGFYNFLNEEDI